MITGNKIWPNQNRSNFLKLRWLCPIIYSCSCFMKQARDYRKYNVRLTSADWQRGSGRVIIIFIPLTKLKTRWHCANLFQPIKGFHFLRLYRIKWAICEDRCLYIGINVKARLSTQPPPQHPLRRFISYTRW